MKKRHNSARTIAVVIFIVILSLVCGLNYVFDPFEDQVVRYPMNVTVIRDTGSYKINPETILESLRRNDINVFAPELATPEAPVFDKPILWNQSDYQEITAALHQLVWKEPLDGWSVYGMKFRTSCPENSSGFTYGEITYFKSIFITGGVLYLISEIEIAPLYGDASWSRSTNYSDPLFGWKNIDLGKIKVNAEDALRIAEGNAGKAARISVQNQCRITVGLSGDSAWKVAYDENSSSSLYLYRIKIDPYTGQITK